MEFVVSAQENAYPTWIDRGNRFIESKWGILLYIVAIAAIVFFYYYGADMDTIKSNITQVTSSIRIGEKVSSATGKFKFTPATGITVVAVASLFIGVVLYIVNYIRYLYSNQVLMISRPISAKSYREIKGTRFTVSDNKPGGLEFAYGMWIKIDDWTYNRQRNKYILVKGTMDGAGSLLSYAPAIYLTDENALRVDTQTFANVQFESLVLNNVPLKQWCHILVAVRGRNLDIYVNGILAKRKILDGIPKQNNGNVHITPQVNVGGNTSLSGFDGLISGFKYFRYYPSQSEIVQELNSLPDEKAQACDAVMSS
jgi:hypothetical protein